MGSPVRVSTAAVTVRPVLQTRLQPACKPGRAGRQRACKRTGSAPLHHRTRERVSRPFRPRQRDTMSTSTTDTAAPAAPANPEQGVVGEGRLHADRGDHASERRGPRRTHRRRPRHRRPRPRVRRRHDRHPRRPARAQPFGVSTSPRTWSPPARDAPSGSDSPTAPSRWATPRTSNGLDDESFDLVVSIFGAMFAPRPFDTAAEMVRVTKPGGRIVMGNWIPGDPTLVAQILRISGSYSPPPPEGFVSPVTWGVEEHVNERFTAAGHRDRSDHLRARHVRVRRSTARRSISSRGSATTTDRR